MTSRPFSELLRKYRQQAGMDQGELAGKLDPEGGGTRSTISRWETGERLPQDSTKVTHLAEILDADIEEMQMAWAAQRLYQIQEREGIDLAGVLAKHFASVAAKIELMSQLAPEVLGAIVDRDGNSLNGHLQELQEAAELPGQFFQTDEYREKAQRKWRTTNPAVDMLRTLHNLAQLPVDNMYREYAAGLGLQVDSLIEKEAGKLAEMHSKRVLVEALAEKMEVDAASLTALMKAVQEFA